MTDPSAAWQLPGADLGLAPDEVHVWRAALPVSGAAQERFERSLSQDERARASRFHFPRDQERFITTRGLLRAILGGYAGLEPAELTFDYSSFGKPSLAPAHGGHGLRFNLSHSGGLALLGITRGREIGIDVERFRPDLATDKIARSFFSPREVSELLALPADARPAAFFACWTRKEAFVKARGEGLSFPLDQFDVSLAPGEPAALLATHGDPQEAQRWTLMELDAGPGYAAALAVEAGSRKLLCWQWPEES
jgi:4'-phosphopantetheinyl transferase